MKDFTDITTRLPITNKESFTFNITFSENISTDTFTTSDFIIEPEDLVTITTINFNGTKNKAAITATTDIPETQEGNLTISVGKNYEDLAGNSPDTDQQLYEIDVERPTVTATDSESNEATDATNDYIITYTFSEEVVGITNGSLTASDFDVTADTGTIANDITHDGNIVMLAVTSSQESIEITVKNFRDISKNVGNEDTATFSFGDISVTQANSIIRDNDITLSENNYTFTLTFTNEISASTLTTSDFFNNDTNPNIQIVGITSSTGTAKDFTVEFKFVDDNTEAVDFTIAVGAVGDVQTNSEPIKISIDRAPRDSINNW